MKNRVEWVLFYGTENERPAMLRPRLTLSESSLAIFVAEIKNK